MKNNREEIAARIRGARESAGVDVDLAASHIGVAAATYLAYEAGEIDVPMSTLPRLAELFDVDTATLVTGASAHARVYSVTRRGRGAVVARRSAYHYESLTAGFAHSLIDAYIVTVQPRDTPPHLDSHPGEEIELVVSGRMEVVIDGHAIILNPGDCIYFDATRPHGMRALDNKEASFFAAITNR